MQLNSDEVLRKRRALELEMIDAEIRAVLAEGYPLSPPDIREALVKRGWTIEAGRAKNTLKVVYAALGRLTRSGEIRYHGRDDRTGRKLFIDSQKRAELSEQEMERAERERRESIAGREYWKKQAEARAQIKTGLLDGCIEVLLASGKWMSPKKIAAELKLRGFDFSCYSQPSSAVAFVLKDQPGVKWRRARSGVRYYRIDNGPASGASSGETSFVM